MSKALGQWMVMLALFCAGLALAASPSSGASLETSPLTGPESKRLNIVLILADDLGFTDLGSYGSEIRTPTLDNLAAEGVRFTNFHSAANCAPARAMLLTGVDNQLAGVPNIPEMLTPEQLSRLDSGGTLGDNVVTVATLLEGAGYRTYMSGKWHLGMAPEKRPSARGFQRTVAMMDSGADHWEQRPYLPLYDQANWYADGERLDLPEDFYSSEFLVDALMDFIVSDSDQQSPFFAYLPFMAVHMPVQAPRSFVTPYLDTYAGGWDELRESRRKRAAALGVIPKDSPMVRMSTTADWSALDEEAQAYETKRMAVYAGMVEAMDWHLGRLIQFLKERDEYANTVFIFTSDNGTEASGPENPRVFPHNVGPRRMGYKLDYESLGEKGSFSSLSPSFASASASPLAFYKFYAGEGGMRVPLIIAGDAISNNQSIIRAFSWVTDITPTILSFAGVEPPGPRYGGRAIEAVTGRSLRPLLAGEVTSVYGETDTVGYELAGNGALFQGDYKLVVNQPPVGDGQWRLFNITKDPGEVIDLAAADPARYQRMLGRYHEYMAANGVMTYPEGYSPLGQVLDRALRKELGKPLLALLVTLLVLLPFWVASRLTNSHGPRSER
jgi:arylsulfatase A-like enzyme